MKRWMGLLLLLSVLLCGCGKVESSPDDTTATVPQRQAITAWEISECDFESLAILGENPVLWGGDEILLVSRQDMAELARVTVEGLDGELVCTTEQGLSYYDRGSRTLTFYDETLSEVGSVVLTADVVGRVLLTQDGQYLYYCTAEGVYALDLSNGISRVLYQKSADWLGVVAGFMDESVLFCQIQNQDGTVETLSILADTGELVWDMTQITAVYCRGNLYFGCLEQDGVQEWIYGWSRQQSRQFLPPEGAQIFFLPDTEQTVTLQDSRLDCFDLAEGTRMASVVLSSQPQITAMAGSNDAVYYLSGGVLYCWDLNMSRVDDDTVYTNNRYTEDSPDKAGLLSCAKLANSLSAQYGVNIILWNTAATVAPEGYTFTVEYVPENISQALQQLETVLAQYPQQIFDQTVGSSQSGKLNIVLVRDMDPEKGELYSDLPGVQYLWNGEMYLALKTGDSLQRTFSHILAHAMDTYILCNSKGLDEWSELNPKDFTYDAAFAADDNTEIQSYLQGDNACFVDELAMTSPVEDRARIFEYAMQPDQQDRFASPNMQAKLKTLCDAIRDAYDLDKDQSYPWEQYLNQ